MRTTTPTRTAPNSLVMPVTLGHGYSHGLSDDLEGFRSFVRRVSSGVTKVVRAVTPIAAPIVGGVVGGPAGIMIGQSIGQLVGGNAAGSAPAEYVAAPQPAYIQPTYTTPFLPARNNARPTFSPVDPTSAPPPTNAISPKTMLMIGGVGLGVLVLLMATRRR